MIDFSALEALEQSLERDWSTLRGARENAAGVRDAIRQTLEADGPLTTEDADLVLFGSLARCEWTSGSDVDWTLLIDGPVDPGHRPLAQSIDARLQQVRFDGKPLPGPGRSGIFGNLEFSHSLIHHIGGEDDTNHNTTQRILLLLESMPLRSGDGDISAYHRVVRAILVRYLRDDVLLETADQTESRIPRFLLNDIVRFWRTMCVDFGWKHWEQAGKKWALRNIKLRMSRKLLFASGYLLVFGCFKNEKCTPAEEAPTDRVEILLRHLIQSVALPPTELIARELTRAGLEEGAGRLFDIYDTYLQKLDDESLRNTLGDLDPKAAYENAVFQEFRELSRRLQQELTDLFFIQDSALKTFTQRYGVF